MIVKLIVANFAAADLSRARQFYAEIAGRAAMLYGSSCGLTDASQTPVRISTNPTT